MTEIDYKQIATRLARAHSEIAGKAYLQGLELDQAKRIIHLLVDQVMHVAQAVHQGHHAGGTWQACDRPFCFDTARLILSIIERDEKGLRK